MNKSCDLKCHSELYANATCYKRYLRHSTKIDAANTQIETRTNKTWI